MPTSLLYLITVAIWGSTWIAIRYQLGVVDPSWSVSYRFLIASLCFGAVALLTRKTLRFAPRHHFLFLIMGLFLYCANYILVYNGSHYLVTGVVALVFSLIPLGNALWGKVMLQTPIKPNVLGGALLGLAGIIVIFWPQLVEFDLSSARLLGLGLVVVAVALASTGNMIAALRQKKGLPLVESNFWAMLYGSVLTAVYAIMSGAPMTFDAGGAYVGSLIYLALFGSFAAFWAYITLIERIGLAQAGYALVVTPIVALGFSTVLEDFHWSMLAIVGVALCLGGNVLMVKR